MTQRRMESYLTEMQNRWKITRVDLLAIVYLCADGVCQLSMTVLGRGHRLRELVYPGPTLPSCIDIGDHQIVDLKVLQVQVSCSHTVSIHLSQ